MYPRFVVEGLIDPSECVNGKNDWCFVIMLWLCCAPSHTCLYFSLFLPVYLICIYVPHLLAGFLPAFKSLLIRLLWFCMPLSRRLSLCVWGLDTHLFVNLWTMRLCTYVIAYQIARILGQIHVSFSQSCQSLFIPSGMLSFMFWNFCLAPGLLELCSFWNILRFHNFRGAPGVLEAFIPSRTFYTSTIFKWVHGVLEASSLPEHFTLPRF
jgi:hypothetical protein